MGYHIKGDMPLPRKTADPEVLEKLERIEAALVYLMSLPEGPERDRIQAEIQARFTAPEQEDLGEG
jgi:hypothetical protein